MKSVLFSACLFFLFAAQAQKNMSRITDADFFYEADAETLKANKDPRIEIKEKKIATITTTRSSKNFTSTNVVSYDVNGNILDKEHTNSKGGFHKETYSYDANGHNTYRERVNSKGEITSTMSREYNAQNKLIHAVETVSGKVQFLRVYQYDPNGNVISEYGTDRKGKFFLRKKKYDLLTNKILVNELYGKDTTTVIKRLEYSYYDDGSKKTISYFEKEKLVYTWSFDCKQEGELVDLKKTDSSLVCKKVEIDSSGNTVSWLHEFNSEGHTVRIKSVTDANGKLVEESSYDSQSIYAQKLFFKDGGYIQLYRDKEGQMYVAAQSILNADGLLVYSSRGHGKWLNQTWNFYTGKAMTRTLELRGKFRSETVYSYTYYN